jgi:hypothetical protein
MCSAQIRGRTQQALPTDTDRPDSVPRRTRNCPHVDQFACGSVGTPYLVCRARHCAPKPMPLVRKITTAVSWLQAAARFSLERSRYFCEVARHWGSESSRSDFSQYSRDLPFVEFIVDILGWRLIPHGGFKRLVVHPALHRTHVKAHRSIRVAQVRAPSNLFCRGDLWGWQLASSARC